MSENIKKWGGWEKITKKELPKPTIIREISKKKTYRNSDFLNPKKLPKIDTGNIKKKVQKDYSKHISKIDSVSIPKLCQQCGSDISSEHFIIFSPEKKYICRGCRQSLNRCDNCGDIIGKSAKTESFCIQCSGPALCRTCNRKLKLSELRRIKGQKGIYCHDCITTREKCTYCDAPYDKKLSDTIFKYPICKNCNASAIKTQIQAEEILFNIKDFLYEIYMGINATFDDYSIKLNNDISAISTILDTEHFFKIENHIINILNGIPETTLTEVLLDAYSSSIFVNWSKVKNNDGLFDLLVIFMKMNYYEKFNIYQKYEHFKKIGLAKNKAFLPLYQASYKNGFKKGFKIIYKLLNE